MDKDNYTLEELTDLLETQVVLTLINDGEIYKSIKNAIEYRDYPLFRNNLIHPGHLSMANFGLIADDLSHPQKRCLKFWQELNDYAVSQRGKSAKNEYEAVCVDQNEQLLQQVADESRYQ